MESEQKFKRRGVRFVPEIGTVAILSYNSPGPNFNAQYAGLVLTESAQGCSIIYVGGFLKVGDEISIKVGEMAPVVAEVRWVIQLDDNVQKVGFQYLD